MELAANTAVCTVSGKFFFLRIWRCPDFMAADTLKWCCSSLFCHLYPLLFSGILAARSIGNITDLDNMLLVFTACVQQHFGLVFSDLHTSVLLTLSSLQIFAFFCGKDCNNCFKWEAEINSIIIRCWQLAPLQIYSKVVCGTQKRYSFCFCHGNLPILDSC